MIKILGVEKSGTIKEMKLDEKKYQKRQDLKMLMILNILVLGN